MIKLPVDWERFFLEKEHRSIIDNINKTITADLEKGKTIYPEVNSVYRALEYTPIDNIHIVILGQDPYPNNNAIGLSFGVPRQNKIPQSLRNMFNELNHGADATIDPTLINWAKQGVLLLNTALTFTANQSNRRINEHMSMWKPFTKHIIDTINDECNNIVFLAWGKHAHKHLESIDTSKHHVIKTSHPTNMSYRKEGKDFSAFYGSRCFDKANSLIKEPINWLK